MPTNVNTSSGMQIFKSLDLDESEEEVKGSEGVVFTIYAVNSNAAARYLKLYDGTLASVVVGTTVPKATYYLAPLFATPIMISTTVGYEFFTGITAAATTGAADNDTGAPGANEVICVIGYA